MRVEVRHNEAASRFETTVEGLLCRADYRLDGNTMRVFHTEVPRALEGRGIAAELVRAAFEHAAQHGLKVDPACSYVRVWARRHPEVERLLARA
ncbi:GNAT family N-acetyltransferase [Zeimonas arvi]|uniref:N-acetyltransferase n=1 Tax=Zeimonas arvi TaxID=2498847 RepID=A0A5C8P1V2_9BURK|nr:GNAT family N-acetyltransferase [Zeimonas arvi]TXL67203.1 N-acetyltransferase [Zeimonas arvi]